MQTLAPTRRLKLHLPTISLLVASLSICSSLTAQVEPGQTDRVLPPEIISDQPPNRPARQPPAAQPPAAQQQPASALSQPAPRSQPRRAEITYKQGLLTIDANDSSLNSILREISRQTGMTITGGVTDERVFGRYGPSALGPILATLLDGTRSNMLFVNPQNGRPSELILTARNGGPTPPNPNASRERDEEEQRQGAFVPPAPNPNQSQPPPQQNIAPPPAGTPPSASNGATTDQQSPNGVKTPQQIYDQLMKLRQPQGQTQTPAQPQTNPQ